MKILKKIKHVLFEPGDFFRKLNEKGIKNAFIYTLVIGAFFAVLYAIMQFFFFNFTENAIANQLASTIFNGATTAVGPTGIVAMAILCFIGVIVGSFIGSAILHVWLLIWRVKSKYVKTYQLLAYGRTPGYIFGWIPFVNFVIWIYTTILLITGTMKVYGVKRRKAIWIYLVPVIIAAVLFVLVMLYFVPLGTVFNIG